ncbi:MAG: penicillin acylase family protein, partial [Gemmatimonadales bacterium]
MHLIRLLVAAALLAGLLWAGARPIGPLPPLRPLLDPWAGVWQVAARSAPPAELDVTIPTLDGPVEVRVDDRGVPHVFATTEADAWRVQGWLVARDRLFQLNLQTRATAGRLTEWVGAQALEADRESRRLGLARAAERQWAALAQDTPSRLAMEAYAEGVNAWIAGLHPSDRPFEFRLLGVEPDRWEPQHTLYLFQRMGTVLALNDPTQWRTQLAARVGREAAEALVPIHSPVQEPIQPNGQFAPRIDPLRLPPPGAPDSAAHLLVTTMGPGREHSAGDAVGSNNWAVSPGRTAAGKALLSGDPHLSMTLPSTWYEVHLVVPDLLDVAGATLPGAPGVIIGHNRTLAWSVTNTGSDVIDFYRETVDDVSAPSRYRLDGEWRELSLEPTEYRDQRGRLLQVDTLRFNYRGPVTLVDGSWLSRRWTLHEIVADPHVWIHLNRAATVDEGLAVTAPYVGPAQNFVLADQAGTIAIRSTGYYPIRPGDGRGDGIRDGAASASDWLGWQPVSRYPFSRNPPQGFLASANQEPVDPRASVAYLGADWPPPYRAMRINQLLRADSAVTPEAMRFFQTDPGSAAADIFVPQFLRAGADALRRDSARVELSRALRLLGEWDRRYTLENRRAALFEAALTMLGRLTWDELIPAGDSIPRFQPNHDLLVALLEDPLNPWWDDRRTAAVETRDEILALALESGLALAIERHGDPDGPGWRWAEIRQANIHHLLRLAPLSRLAVPMASGTGTLSPSGGSGVHGASWRMVVELGEEVRAWVTYPGGQSGNPLSRWYDDR